MSKHQLKNRNLSVLNIALVYMRLAIQLLALILPFDFNFHVSIISFYIFFFYVSFRVAVVNKITDFLLFLGTLMVTAAIVLIAFFFFAFGQDYAVTSFIATDVINVPSVRYYWVIIFVSQKIPYLFYVDRVEK